MNRFIGRKAELLELEDRYHSAGFQMTVICDPWCFDPESTRDDTVERVSYDKGELSIQFRVSIQEKENLLTKRYLCKIRVD